MITLPQEVRSSLAGAAVIAALLVGWIGRVATIPAPDGGSIMAYGDWRVVCPARTKLDANCQLTQDFTDARTGSTVLRFVVYGGTQTIDVVVPYNVLLPKGIGIKLDDRDIKTFPYRTCNLVGCLTTISTDSGFYANAVRAKTIIVSFVDVSGKPITRTLSDKGYADGMSAMRAAQAKRHSWIRRVLW
jgi:invasion protein IalB